MKIVMQTYIKPLTSNLPPGNTIGNAVRNINAIVKKITIKVKNIVNTLPLVEVGSLGLLILFNRYDNIYTF